MAIKQFVTRGPQVAAVIYIETDDILGAYIEDAREDNPACELWLRGVGRIEVSWGAHAADLHAFFRAHLS